MNDEKITEIFNQLEIAVKTAVKELEELGEENASEAVFDYVNHIGL